jgi:hypothetical protein
MRHLLVIATTPALVILRPGLPVILRPGLPVILRPEGPKNLVPRARYAILRFAQDDRGAHVARHA